MRQSFTEPFSELPFMGPQYISDCRISESMFKDQPLANNIAYRSPENTVNTCNLSMATNVCFHVNGVNMLTQIACSHR